ncbi:hypothetical protein BGZ54_003346, partial [Gamsiella multidivaricata]
MSLRVYSNFSWETEISVFEFKPANASADVCDHQQRKSVRLNTAVLLERGLDAAVHFPVIAEGRGLHLDFYTLRRYEDVHGAGKTTSKSVWLPYDEYTLKEWLMSDSLHILLAFT